MFNNKGGVGKTTLTFHPAHALAELGRRALLIDLGPLCNLTVYGMDQDALHDVWREEDAFVADFKSAQQKLTAHSFNSLFAKTRSIHFLIKTVEDGIDDLPSLPPPRKLANNLDLIRKRGCRASYRTGAAGSRVPSSQKVSRPTTGPTIRSGWYSPLFRAPVSPSGSPNASDPAGRVSSRPVAGSISV